MFCDRAVKLVKETFLMTYQFMALLQGAPGMEGIMPDFGQLLSFSQYYPPGTDISPSEKLLNAFQKQLGESS